MVNPSHGADYLDADTESLRNAARAIRANMRILRDIQRSSALNSRSAKSVLTGALLLTLLTGCVPLTTEPLSDAKSYRDPLVRFLLDTSARVDVASWRSWSYPQPRPRGNTTRQEATNWHYMLLAPGGRTQREMRIELRTTGDLVACTQTLWKVVTFLQSMHITVQCGQPRLRLKAPVANINSARLLSVAAEAPLKFFKKRSLNGNQVSPCLAMNSFAAAQHQRPPRAPTKFGTPALCGPPAPVFAGRKSPCWSVAVAEKVCIVSDSVDLALHLARLPQDMGRQAGP